MRAFVTAGLVVSSAAFAAAPARAAGEPSPDLPSTPEGGALGTDAPRPFDEAPPLAPRHRGLVVESGIGALGYTGSFRGVARPAFWFNGDVGYEVLPFLMVLGYGELAVTDTSVSQGPTAVRAFPMFGFGGGLRGTFAVSDRVSVYVQAQAGALQADVPSGALANLGYGALESLGFVAGGRVGVEWYQVNPHLALAIVGGPRYAASFKRAGSAETPLLWDGALSLRYAF